MIRNQKLINIIFFSILLCRTSMALADDISVTATVDKTETTVEDSINLSITVSGKQNSPQPRLPPLPDFKVQSMGTSSSIQIINMKVSSMVTFNYRLDPLKTGTFMVPPATLEIDGKAYSTNPITLHIKGPSAALSKQDAPVFAQMTVSNDKPYVNEQVTLTLKLYRRVDVKNINLNISDEGFRKEDLGKSREYEQVMDGIGYHVLELSIAIFPIKPGKMEIPPATMDLDILNRLAPRPSRDPFAHFFDDSLLFGGRVQPEHKTIRTNPITLNIQPLPEAGKPPTLSNLVGQFAISAALEKDHVDVGDSATLTVTISGKGNVKDIPEPKPDVQTAFKVYPDQPEFKQNIEGNKIAGQKIFKFALVPLHEGKITIPPIPLSYFDPEQKKHVNTSTKSLTIYANPIKEQLKVVEADNLKNKPEPTTIKIIGKDILPIHTRISDFKDMQLTSNRLTYYTAGIALPAFLYFVLAYYLNHKQRLQHDVAYARSRNAYKLAKKRLDAIASSYSSNTKDFVRELSKVLREYIGNKTNLQGTAFTPIEMEEKLKERNYQEDLIKSVSCLLGKCESLQYAPAQTDDNLARTLLEESSAILVKIEKQI